MAIALAQAGADVAVVARGACAETATQIRALGRRCLVIQADLSQRGGHDPVVPGAVDSFGWVDILVNNAGAIRRAPFMELTGEDWDEVMETNLRSAFRLSQDAAKQMVRQGAGGRIINTASMLSFQGGIRVASYTASKSGLAGLTRLMANELGPLGITCNAIAPGYMATENTRPIRDDPARNQAILERIPLGRWGTPEDLYGAVVFLASDAAAYVNGSILAVDGGWLCR
jgi:2-deoxy-D-gluconate 3-dehydrogenase